MRIDIMTLFPEMVENAMCASMIGRAQKAGLVEINAVYIRDFAHNKHRKTDDYPYGGGMGLVMMAEPLYECHKHLCAGAHVHTVLMSAQGRPFRQSKAKKLLSYEHIILICGHYEGIDERFIEECVDEEISLGDFVLTGGEIPAMAVTDAITRMIPGVLSDNLCFEEESHFAGFLEYPQYTRPETWHDRRIPEILLSGHHENIRKWRRRESIIRTASRRPDMIRTYRLSKDEQTLTRKIRENIRKKDDPRSGIE